MARAGVLLAFVASCNDPPPAPAPGESAQGASGSQSSLASVSDELPPLAPSVPLSPDPESSVLASLSWTPNGSFLSVSQGDSRRLVYFGVSPPSVLPMAIELGWTRDPGGTRERADFCSPTSGIASFGPKAGAALEPQATDKRTSPCIVRSSADGATVANALLEGDDLDVVYRINVWRAGSWLRELTPPAATRALALSEDGQRVVAVGDEVVMGWEVATGSIAFQHKGHFPRAVLSRTGAALAYVNGSQIVAADTASNATIARTSVDAPSHVSNLALRFSPNGKQLFVGAEPVGWWKSLDLDARTARKLNATASRTGLLQMSDDGSVAVEVDDQKARVVDLTGQRADRVLGESGVHEFSLAPDGRRLVGVGVEEIVVWSLPDALIEARIPLPAPPEVKRVKWRTTRPEPPPRAAQPKDLPEIKALAWSLDAARLAILHPDRLSLLAPEDHAIVAAELETVAAVAIEFHGGRLLVCGSDGGVRIHDATSGSLALALEAPLGFDAQECRLALSRDEHVIAQFASNQEGAARFRVWSADGPGFELPGQFYASSLTFSDDAQRLFASGSGQGAIWELKGGQRVARLPIQYDGVFGSGAISPDARFVAEVGGQGHDLSLLGTWPPRRLELLAVLTGRCELGHFSTPWFSHDSRMVFFEGQGTLYGFELDPSPVRRIKMKVDPPAQVSEHGDIVVHGTPGTIVDGRSGALRRRLPSDTTAYALAPNGKRIAVVRPGALVVLDVSSGSEIQRVALR